MRPFCLSKLGGYRSCESLDAAGFRDLGKIFGLLLRTYQRGPSIAACLYPRRLPISSMIRAVSTYSSPPTPRRPRIHHSEGGRAHHRRLKTIIIALSYVHSAARAQNWTTVWEIVALPILPRPTGARKGIFVVMCAVVFRSEYPWGLFPFVRLDPRSTKEWLAAPGGTNTSRHVCPLA